MLLSVSEPPIPYYRFHVYSFPSLRFLPLRVYISYLVFISPTSVIYYQLSRHKRYLSCRVYRPFFYWCHVICHHGKFHGTDRCRWGVIIVISNCCCVYTPLSSFLWYSPSLFLLFVLDPAKMSAANRSIKYFRSEHRSGSNQCPPLADVRPHYESFDVSPV